MSNKKYTPGPWEIFRLKRKTDGLTFAEITTEDRGKIYIAETQTHMLISEEEAMSNSKLIVTAPEMAEALLHIHRIFKLDVKTREMIEAVLKKAGVLK